MSRPSLRIARLAVKRYARLVKSLQDLSHSMLGDPKPIGLVVIMLGPNDLKMRFPVSAYDIANGAGVLIDIVGVSATGPGDAPPQVLLLAPPPVARLTGFREMFEGE